MQKEKIFVYINHTFAVSLRMTVYTISFSIMKIILRILSVFILSLLCLWNTFAYKELLIENRGGKPIRVIKVVLDWQHFVITSLASTWWDTLENLVKNVWWDSGINGTFFCPKDYSYCGGVTHSNFERIFLWDWESYSASWPETSVRMIFSFDIEWNPFLAQHNYTDHDAGLEMNLNEDKIDDIEFWLSNYTVLLVEWQNVIDVNSIQFSSNMYSSANRNFICSTKDGSTIYMWVVWWVSIPKLADYVEKNFGCRNALALDAWASEAMVYDWNVLARSSRRKIMDAFVIVDRETYIKLTWYTPKKKTPYIPENNYELTKNDMSIVNILASEFKRLLKKEWQNYLSVEKAAVREVISTENIQKNPQKKAMLHELLVRLFIIDKL